MGASSSIVLEVSGRVASITIDREARRNSVDNEALEGLIGAFEKLRRDPVSVLVLCGAGEKAFCAGSDLKALAEYSYEDAVRHTRLFLECTEALEELPCATIAAIEGFCFGGGLEIALACDARIASTESQFGFPEITVGALPTGGGTVSAPRAIGFARAREMMVFGERINADLALQWGLVGSLTEPGTVLTAARERAEGYASRVEPGSIALLKQILVGGYGAPGRTGRTMAVLADSILLQRDSFKEGVGSFAQKPSGKLG